ncbi:hypothetical protein SAMN04515666_103607 [Bosea lupini]|uniref:Homeodomain-like domain-containing protein n=1 Tax=Bosea lupini TaxID=1036779 RepID=A0A1H7PV91_9HYPH|nr:helix-turn-helix domain-containing protein [Bosea lupini]SEL39165.1 hypothetical protein SAMN04515666_103607 [Bosea lupini]
MTENPLATPLTAGTGPRERFLAALGEGLSVAGAAKLAGIGRQTVYDWRKRDGEFAAAWDDAIETGTDNLEDEARRRAMSTSDTLMIFMLKARRPEKYKERYAAEHTGKNGERLMPERFPKITDLTMEELLLFEGLMSKACGVERPEREAGGHHQPTDSVQ